MRVLVVTPPDPVVSLAQAKAHLRVDSDDEDALIAALIEAATGHIDGPDGWLGRAIGEQTLEVRFDVFHGDDVRLPFEPVIGLVGVSWLGADSVLREGDLADFDLLGRDLVPESGTWAWTGCSVKREAIRIQYRAGYETVPAPIVAAILLMLADLYRNPSSVTAGPVSKVPMSTTVENLLTPFRVWR